MPQHDQESQGTRRAETHLFFLRLYPYKKAQSHQRQEVGRAQGVGQQDQETVAQVPGPSLLGGTSPPPTLSLSRKQRPSHRLPGDPGPRVFPGTFRSEGRSGVQDLEAWSLSLSTLQRALSAPTSRQDPREVGSEYRGPSEAGPGCQREG